MKIHPEQTEALQQAKTTSRSASKTQGDFSEMLHAEVAKTSGKGTVQAPPLRPPTEVLTDSTLPAVAPAQKAGTDPEQGQAVMKTVEQLLSNWEMYAARLDSPVHGKDLRKVSGSLEQIESDIDALKTGFPSLGVIHPNLQDVVDELEILAVTERIKFNRGDYVE